MLKSKVAKVPVIMQLEALECGAACLAMILAYYKKWLPLEQVRYDCGVSRDGSKAKNILLAARNYGLEAKGYRYDVDELKEEVSFPCILHWEFNHFVVLDGFRNGKAIINDPARGVYSVSEEEFDESYTGICLQFRPGKDFKKEGKPKSIMGFVKEKLEGSSFAFTFITITTLITSVFAIVNPAFSRFFLDSVLGGNGEKWIYPFTFILGLFAIVTAVVEIVRQVFSQRLNGKLAAIGNARFMWHVLRLPMTFFSQRFTGDILQRQQTNASIAQILVNTLAPLVLNTCTMILFLVVMLRYSVFLSILGIFSVLVNFALSRYIAKKKVNITRVMMRDSGKLASSTVNGIDMIETIKASGAENGYFEHWAGYQANVNTQDIKYSKLNTYYGAIPTLVSALTDVIVLTCGIYLVMQGEFTTGMLLAFQGFLSSFAAPAGTLVSASQTIQEMRSDMERVEDVLKYKTDQTCDSSLKDEDVEYDKLSGNIEINNVTFGYSRLSEPVVKNFSLSVKRGSKVAIVGFSGCGKSTMSKLISGLYRPWEGTITFDGKTVDQIDHSVFTGSLAVVDQDIILYEDTIANNIKMWDKSIADYEMILAARDAHIHENIMMREGGYQYRLTEGGSDFSGGERQRLEIARVLAQDPTIVILDEATSALDARTEYDVVQSIQARGVTCIVIAHRLSTIRDCDEIIVLDHGEIVDRGTHDELMSHEGLYSQLVMSE